ncbi:MAG TPA: hypothetical protein VGJ19_10895 [Streptosporangiaceae bacterium]
MTVTAAVLAKASSDNVTPGVLGFLVVAGIGVALYFLLKSMSKQLKKIPPPPPDENEDGEAGPAKPLSPLQAAAARRREAAAAQESAGRSPDSPGRLG